MQLIYAQIRQKHKLKFRCIKHFSNKSHCTHNHSIFYNDLISEIKKQLKSIIENYIDSNEYSELCKSIAKDIYSKILEKRKTSLYYELTTIKKQIKDYYKNSLKTSVEQIYSQELDILLEKQKTLVKNLEEIRFEKLSSATKNFILSKILVEVKEHIRIIMHDDNVINKLIKKIEIGHLEKTSNVNRQKITLYYNF